MEDERLQQIERIVQNVEKLHPCFAQIQHYYTPLCDGRCEYASDCVWVVMRHIYRIQEK